jgi:hypothetical protein
VTKSKGSSHAVATRLMRCGPIRPSVPFVLRLTQRSRLAARIDRCTAFSLGCITHNGRHVEITRTTPTVLPWRGAISPGDGEVISTRVPHSMGFRFVTLSSIVCCGEPQGVNALIGAFGVTTVASSRRSRGTSVRFLDKTGS